MNTFKNLIIALLTGLLALSLFTQPARCAPAKISTAAKIVQFDFCFIYYATKGGFQYAIDECKKYQP